jgi:hypothetical protein
MATAQKGRQQAMKMPPLWDRLDAQITWYDKKAKTNQRAYKWSKAAIIVLAIAIPIVAEYGFLPVPGVEDTRALWVGVAAGAILLLEGLQQINKWQENWILYRSTCEGLRNEQHLYNEKAGPYAKLPADEAHRVLAERVGALASAEHSKWVAVAREKVHDHAGE